MKRCLVALALAGVIAFNGCIGSFSLTNKLYSWNQKATSDKYINTGIMWVLLIVPVYHFSMFVDFVILNTIEFWTGKNPMEFTGPNTLEKVVTGNNGNTYKVTMGNCKITIDQLTGTNAGKEVSVIYVKETGSYYMNNGSGNPVEVASLNGSMINLYTPDGKVLTQSLSAAPAQMALAR